MCSMYVLWIICGAGRCVGKTHLARRLCEVLPESVYAKLGHGRRKPDGWPHFFRTQKQLQNFMDQQRRQRHVVVESNALAVRRDADVVIYLAPQSGRSMNVRADAESLRSAADVRIEPGASQEQWNQALMEILPDPALRRLVLGVLQEQAAFGARPYGGDDDEKATLSIPAVEARTKLWLETDGKHALGRGLAALLEGVDAGGSLTRAAAQAGMSYRYAWHLVHQAETNLGEPLLIGKSGGRRGGGSVLSQAGRNLLGVFEKLDVEVAAFASERLEKLIRETSEDG